MLDISIFFCEPEEQLMKKRLFKGAATALVTPFKKDGSLDLDGLGSLIEHQIEGGISALVLAGTTGEGSTLTFDEFSLLIAKANEFVHHRVPLIVGTGSNDTATALKRSLEAEKRGADGLLIVTPYYNKTTQSGLIRHYCTIADRVHTPIILYNVPSRTGLKIEPQTCKVLSEHPNIIGIKEASGNISNTLDIAASCPNLSLYSGNDDQILPILALGGDGVISVASNIIPREIQQICNFFNENEISKALHIQKYFLPLFRALFCQVNPIPIKYAMQVLDLPSGEPRLPLIHSDDEAAVMIKKTLHEVGLY